LEENFNITEDSTDYFSIIKNNQTNQPITKDVEELDSNISQEIENNAIEMDLDYFSEDNVMYTEDSEDYSQGFSLDALEKTYLKRLQEEEEDDELDLEIDVLTPPKIEGYVDKKTGKFVEIPYIPVITAESIEREEREKGRKGFDRLRDAWGELIDLGDTKEEILKNGKEMKTALLEDMGKTNVRNDPLIILMANLVGSGGRGAKVFEKVINGIQLGMAGSQDALEAGLIQLQELSPSTFDAISKIIPNSDTPSKMTDEISEAIGAGAEFAETTGAFGLPQLLIRTSSHMKMKRKVKYRIKNKNKIVAAQKKFLETAKRNNINNVRHRKAEADILIQSQADKIARVEVEIVDDLLDAMETRVGKSLSKTDKDGIRSVDMDKVKKAGLEITEELEQFDLKSDGNKANYGFFDTSDTAISDDGFVMPVLKPEKFNRLVAVIKDLKENSPEKFSKVNKDGTKKNLLDNIFDIALKADKKTGSILDSELGDVLIKYGLSYEDYMLAAIGSGSEAGKILNKLSQMVTASSPETILRTKRKNDIKKRVKNIRRGIIRIESARRGILVSQLATAARNLSSGVIRAPFEVLASVMDTTILKYAEAPDFKTGVQAAIDVTNPLKKEGADNWSDSFSLYKYMFKDMETAKNFSELLLEQPEFKVMYDKMFETLNEIQKASGRGTGTAFDKIMSETEDVVQALNIPNRWQEMLVRRGTFFSEMQRLTRREWGIDLLDTLQTDGNNLRKLIGDSSEFKPKGKLSFAEMMEQSTRKALDLTYAKEPETAVFRSASRFIVNNGLTVVIPFPRFMFATMELMGNYGGGMSIPLTRYISRNVSDIKVSRNLTKLSPKEFKKKYGITKKQMMKSLRDPEAEGFYGYGGKSVFADKATGQMDRQRAIRNLQGIAVAGAAYMYRSSDDAPANLYEMYMGDDTVVDVSAQWPMRQFLWVGEQIAKIVDGTYGQQDWKQWYAEASKTFLGANFRTGQGAMLLDEVQEILIGGSTDLSKGQNTARITGKAISNWLGSWAVPLAQVIDVQRALGMRTVKFKDSRPEPTFSPAQTFWDAIKTPWRKFGDPAAEAELPDSPFIFSVDKERVSPISKIAFGLNMYTRDEPWAEYAKRLGLKEWIIDSSSKVPSVIRLENRLIEEQLPNVVDIAKRNEEYFREDYRNSNKEAKETETEESYVMRNSRVFIKEKIAEIKQQVKDGKFAESSDLVRAQVNYRKLSREEKAEAHFLFVQNTLDENGKGILPDPNNVEHLQKLKFIGDLVRKRYN
jgi:Arc/MetJ-type ribon-helix-helix transcriptional regulator